MSEEKNITQEDRFDEEYRRSLGTMKVEPSARAWNRMSRLLLWRELLRLNFSNLPGYTWVIVAAVTVIVGGGIYWFASDDSEIPAITPIVSDNQTITTSQPSSPPVQNLEAKSIAGSTARPAAEPPAEIKHAGSGSGDLKITTTEQPAISHADASAYPAATAATTTATISPAPLPAALPEIDLLEPESFIVEMPVSGAMFMAVPNPKPVTKPMYDITPTGNKIPTAWNFGLNITPDIVFYKSTSSYFKYDYTLDAAAQYDFGRFYLQSALGVSWSSDIGSYAVSANKNDSIGYYYSVTSFVEYPGDPGSIEYTTTLNTVYDTNQYVYDYSTKNTYTYLEVPLVVGFRAVVRPTWSMAVDAGGFWSGLISANEPVPVFYIPEGRITSVENTTPARRKNSFGLIGSVRFEYIFGKQFSLVIAPTFKYHLNSIEDQNIPGATQPWSIGFRAGIWYRIDLKK